MAEPTLRETTIAAIKKSLRISHSELDTEISAQVDACLKDLNIVGVDGASAVETDPIIISALKLWCRAYMTDDVTKAAAYWGAYDAQKGTLMMATDYGADEDEATVV